MKRAELHLFPNSDDFRIAVVAEQGGHLFPTILILLHKILGKCKRIIVAWN
jgi:hypothetical protein